MGLTAAGAVGLSLTGDLLFEEYPDRIHPVALFGRVVGWFDRDWPTPQLVGILVAAVLPLAGAVLAGGLTAVALGASPVLGAVVAGSILFATVSLRMLVSVSERVIRETATEPERARESVSALVGRETTALSPGELRSAAVESAAENLADGLVAPLLAFAVGVQVSLAVGVAAAVWVKAVNTLDSMLGYRSKPVGWASARLDDIVMWLPARVSALLLAVAAGNPGALGRARAWANDPPSPNSGWPMATLAAILDVRLTKPGCYDLNPEGSLPTTEQGIEGTRIVRRAGLCAFALAALAGLVAGVGA